MTISVKHAFASAKADGTDSTLIQPSNWNAEHTISLAAGKVLGRDSSGAGAMQELPLSFDTSGNMAMSATGSFIPAVGTTAQRPGSPTQGMVRFNTTSSKVELYNGTIWGSVGGGATISDTAPSSPSAGDLWWKSDEGQMYVYYTDANTSQWVVANAYAGGSAYLPLAGGTLTGTLNGTNASFSGTLSGTLNGSNLVATSVAMSKLNATGTPGATNYLRGDGSWQVLTQGQLQAQLFTASGTWTAPTGVTQVRATVIGGGGGGGGGNALSGGGSGGISVGSLGAYTVVPGTAYTVTVGTGGAGKLYNGGTGGSGTTSSFASFCSSTGGAGGAASVSACVQGATGAAGVGSSGTITNFIIPNSCIFQGAGTVRVSSTSSAVATALAYSATSGGAAGTLGVGGSSVSASYYSVGGTGGVVYIEWVG